MEENNKKHKEEDSDDNYKDYFWVKVLVVTIVIIWLSLAAGTWVGNFLTVNKILPSKADTEVSAEQKPKAWKTIVEVDNHGNLSKTGQLDGSSENVNIDDFRNIDDPIPGVDDQSIKVLNSPDINVVQEPPKPVPPPLPGASVTPSESPSSPEPQPSESSTATATATKTQDTNEDHKEKKEHKESKDPAEKKPSPEPTLAKPAKTPEPSQPNSNGNYNIQMGSFSNQGNADKMIDDLKKKGHNATVEKVTSGDKEFYKVKITNSPSQKDAKDKAEELKKEGFDAIVTPN